MQAMRPRHLITGDQKPDAIAASASKKYSAELVKALAKTGIPVEHVAKDTPASDNAMTVEGSFTSVKEGNKAERDTIGLGAGGADVQTKVDVHLKTPSDSVLLSQFTTDTKTADECRVSRARRGGPEPRGRRCQVHGGGSQEERQRLRLEDSGRDRDGDHQVDGRAGLGQD